MIGEELEKERIAFAALDGAKEIVPPRFAPAGDRVGAARVAFQHRGENLAKGFAVAGVLEAGLLRAETEE